MTKIKLTEKENSMFKEIANSGLGLMLTGHIKRVIEHYMDIRNIEGDNLLAEKKGREIAVQILEDEFISRLRASSNTAVSQESYQ
jgi:hypothetical protein